MKHIILFFILIGHSFAQCYPPSSLVIPAVSFCILPYQYVQPGTGDMSAAIRSAQTALPSTGGTILFPQGSVTISAPITFTKSVNVIGAGYGGGSTAGTNIYLTSGVSIIFQGSGSSIQDVNIYGGGVGNGIYLNGQRQSVQCVYITGMVGNGLRIGTDTTTNCNGWRIDTAMVNGNGGDGVYIHSDNTGALPNANAGTATGLLCEANGAYGLHLKNTLGNTFVGTLTESNTNNGIFLEGEAGFNSFIGGDQEGNGTYDFNISASTCNHNYLFNCLWVGSLHNTGTGTINP